MAPRPALVLLAGLLLAAPLAAAADVPPKQRVCTAAGCVLTDDQDGDGRVDWENAALAAGQLVYLNANANRTNASWWAGVTTEEHEPLHGPDDMATGLDAWGYANLTGRDGGPGFNDTDVNVLLFQTDHETGEFVVLREETAYVGDSDRDGRPDRFRPDWRELLP